MSIITPPPYGRPDYSAPQVSLFSTPLVDALNPPFNPGQVITYGPFDVGQWGYIGGKIGFSSFPILATLTWYNDLGMDETYADTVSWTIVPPSLENTDFYIPNKSRFVTLSIQNIGPSPDYGLHIEVYGSNSPAATGINPMSSSVSQFNETVVTTPVQAFATSGAFTTFTYYVSAGTGTITVSAPSSTGNAGVTFWADTGFSAGIYHTATMVMPVGSWFINVGASPNPTDIYYSVANVTPW